MTYTDKTNSLTPFARAVIEHKNTEPPHSGIYQGKQGHGTYLCRRCGIALFRASHQFISSCGWPSFDDEIEGRIKQIPDKDGFRTEILCQRCDGHLGHIFTGEYLTIRNKRHCVNSVSIDFVLDETVQDTDEVIVAGGCFWGVEHYLQQIPGVLMAESGYTGGTVDNPSYNQVCNGDTGHYEAVRVLFDREKATSTQVLTRFFNIHDPSQSTGQGPDRGPQYRSAIFFHNDQQAQIAKSLCLKLEEKGIQLATQLLAAQPFWPAEQYHQDFYEKQGHKPYCHSFVERLPEDSAD
ncbi:bifunctional methionine sulfoxide reductase B/A protein [Legionella sp. W05-934-2]|jgi:peptide methionine sulfoxide reductase msrA/msrB|uniref:bifunctional methionine sulfoxide reductase B/A protein n=1 Tax=Legionella sp. W05-934-2 TaxID=1198649 RepID=UPI003461FC05